MTPTFADSGDSDDADAKRSRIVLSTAPALMAEDSDDADAGVVSSEDDESSIIGGEGSPEAKKMEPPFVWSFRGADNTGAAWSALSAAEKTLQIKFYWANRQQKQLPRVTKEMLKELKDDVRKVSGTPSIARGNLHATARGFMPSWRGGTMFLPPHSGTARHC